MKMEKKALLVLFSFIFLFPIINAQQESVSAVMYFRITQRADIDIEICHEIIDVGKDMICITNEGKFIMIVTASIGITMLAMPSKENHSIGYDDMRGIIEMLKEGENKCQKKGLLVNL